VSNEIIKVRVARDQVKHFPFDLFYLVPIEHKALLSKLFPWSLCIPINETLKRRMMELHVHQGELLPHVTRREKLDGCLGTVTMTLPESWPAKYFMVVPILPMEKLQVRLTKKDDVRTAKKGEKLPGYLTAPQHADANKSKLDGILDDDTVLFTPRGPIRPVCNSCPRHLLHIQHKCELGCKHCFAELVLKRSVNEQLQKDGAQSGSDSDEHPS
jgi:hypothetical protein